MKCHTHPAATVQTVLHSDNQHFNIQVNGQNIPTHHGQTIAAALLAAGRRVLRHTQSGQPRGLFCGMGVCFECLVTVDGVSGQRACVTLVRPGMQVQLNHETGHDHH